MMTMSPGLQRRHEELLDIGPEALAVDWAVDHAGCGDASRRSRGQRRSWCANGRYGALATSRCPRRMRTVRAGHVGLGPGLVDEDETGRIHAGLDRSSSAHAAAGNVRTILLAGVQAFF